MKCAGKHNEGGIERTDRQTDGQMSSPTSAHSHGCIRGMQLSAPAVDKPPCRAGSH